MTNQEFDKELNRIRNSFPQMKYSDERVKQIYEFVADCTLIEFRRIVDHFLASSRLAPLPADFADAARAERNTRFKNDIAMAARRFEYVANNSGLQEYLEEHYPGCKSVNEAIARARSKKNGAQ